MSIFNRNFSAKIMILISFAWRIYLLSGLSVGGGDHAITSDLAGGEINQILSLLCLWMAWACILDPLMMELGLEANTFGRSPLGVTTVSIISNYTHYFYSTLNVKLQSEAQRVLQSSFKWDFSDKVSKCLMIEWFDRTVCFLNACNLCMTFI